MFLRFEKNSSTRVGNGIIIKVVLLRELCSQKNYDDFIVTARNLAFELEGVLDKRARHFH
jgi:hypothetical protein